MEARKIETMKMSLKEAASLVQTALDEITYYDDEMMGLLDTDSGPIDVLLEEVLSHIRQKIKYLKP